MLKLKPFLKYLKACRWQFAFALACGLAYGACSGLGVPVIFEKVFKQIFEEEQRDYSLWQVIAYAALLPTVFLGRGVFGFLNGYFMSFSGMTMIRGLKTDIFRRIQYLPMRFFDTNTQGDLIARMAGDPEAVRGVVMQLAAEMFKQPVQMISGFSYLTYTCIDHGTYLFIPIFFVAVLCGLYPVKMLKRALRNAGGQVQAVAGGVYQQITENLGATAEVRSFTLEEDQIEKHSDLLGQSNRFGLRVIKYQMLQQPMMEIMSTAVVGIVFAYAYYVDMPFSAFSSVGLALYFSLDPMKKIGNLLSEVHRTEASIDRVNYILNMPLCIEDKEDAIPVERLKGDIEFKDVHFSYTDDAEAPALRGVSATIPAGTSCALVGASGAGKSTFAKLISRFYDISSGQISVDGMDLSDIRLKDLRRNIAIVSQYPVLFNDSIYNNIQLGRPDATKEQIEAAAKHAFAHDFISQFPDGYDTSVGDRGDSLSGGQKQRVAISRAFLKNAPILVLDEATSALDSQSEAYIQKALNELIKGKTVFTIAHRLSTIKNADQILVFEKGRIVSSGKHSELMESCPYYRNYVEKQSLK